MTVNDLVGASASQSYSITVGPGPFAEYDVAVAGSSTTQAGSSFLVTVQAADSFGNPVSNYTGPTSVTATISPTSTASNFPTTVAINAQGLGLFLGNLQKVGNYTISVANGSFMSNAAPMTVVPGSAVKVGFGTQPVNTPTGVTLPAVTVQVLDAFGNLVMSDNTDSVAVGIASGPPGAPGFLAGTTTTAMVHNGVATFNNLTLVVPGSYKLSELVPTLYTGANSTAFSVLPLQVLPGSFAATPTGFSVSFNVPFLVNSTNPIEFGQGFGATAPVPTVTLTGPSGVVEGSLIVNPGAAGTTNSLTFVETDTASNVNNMTPILPDGTYTVMIHGTAAGNGLQALNPGGGFLDGTSSGMPGNDFTTTFTVNAAASGDDVLWVPATADGPGQPLEAPGNNQSGGGYPIYLDAPFAPLVSDVQATLSYNPALLSVTSTSSTNFSAMVTSPGTVVLHYHGVGLNGAQVVIGTLTASVPAGSAGDPTLYKAKNLLHLSSVTINGSASEVATADGLHLVAYVGDVDGNGSYSSNDAVLITRVGLQTDSGFTAYPLVDPVIVADTDGSGFIPPDAPLQVNEAGVAFATSNLPNPPIPPGVVFVPVGNNVDPTLSLGIRDQGAGVSSTGIVTAVVNLDDADPPGSTGLIRANLALTYDPRRFSVSAADVYLGSVVAAANGWTVQPTINPVTGQIAIALSSTMPITSSVGGSLLTIDFDQVGTDTSGSAPIALVTSVNPTGQQVVITELEDAQGTFTLSPAPSNRFDPRIDSMVGAGSPPKAAVIDTPAIEIAMFKGAAPAAAHQGAENRTGAKAILVNPAAPEADSQGAIDATTAGPDQADAAHGAIVTAVDASAVQNMGSLAGQITGLAFQLGNSLSQPSALAAGQNLADRLFQALAPGSLAIGTCPIFIEDTIQRTLVSWPRALATMDGPDSLDWDELDWRGAGAVLKEHGTRREVERPAVHDVAAHQSSLDQCFSQTADYPAQSEEDE